jgi:hypothetical protein
MFTVRIVDEFEPDFEVIIACEDNTNLGGFQV